MAHDFSHLAIFVDDLQEAEAFYRKAFGLEVLFREMEASDGTWHTLRNGTGWIDAVDAGLEISMVALQRDDFTLAIFRGDPQRGTVLEIGVTVAPEDVSRIDRGLPSGADRIAHEYGDLYFVDPFGYRWHIAATGTGFQSNGETSGRWVDI